MQNSDYTILLVEDEENDAMLLKMAFQKIDILAPIQSVKDGLEAIAYLNGERDYANRALHPFPEVLIVDLKMARMSGLELLAGIRDHPVFRVIPTIIMSSSRADLDTKKAYDLGANTLYDQAILFRRTRKNSKGCSRVSGAQRQAQDKVVIGSLRSKALSNLKGILWMQQR
jgi:CheY-like chemotaxis protein